MREKTYLVTDHDGRVKRTLPDGRRVLVAIPGQTIPWSLAEELGLVASAEPIVITPVTEAPATEEPPKPRKRVKKAPEAKKAPAPVEPAPEPVKKPESAPSPKPGFVNYPTKKSSS